MFHCPREMLFYLFSPLSAPEAWSLGKFDES